MDLIQQASQTVLLPTGPPILVTGVLHGYVPPYSLLKPGIGGDAWTSSLQLLSYLRTSLLDVLSVPDTLQLTHIFDCNEAPSLRKPRLNSAPLDLDTLQRCDEQIPVGIQG